MATAAEREHLKHQQQQQQQQPVAPATAEVLRQAGKALFQDVHPEDDADALLPPTADASLLGFAKLPALHIPAFAQNVLGSTEWQGMMQQQQQVAFDSSARNQPGAFVSPITPAAAVAAAAMSAAVAAAAAAVQAPVPAAGSEFLGAAAEDAAAAVATAAAAASGVPQLKGEPVAMIKQLDEYLLHKGIDRQQLRAVLEGFEQAGFIKPLRRKLIQPRGYVGCLKAVGCWVLVGHEHLTLTSPEVKFAVEYTHSDAASFIKQHKAGLGCMCVRVSKPGSGRSATDVDRAAAEKELLEKLDLYAVALLMWRLQHVEGLPLGILGV
jgi:hypothetical protein